MARKIRVFLENIPNLVVIKSFENQLIFIDDEDYFYYLLVVKELSSQKDIQIHSYVLTPNVIGFAITPKNKDSISSFMQSLGIKYVLYFNKKYQRSGTLWDGRFRSCIFDPREYLFDIMSYLENLPINLKLTDDLCKYKFSSYLSNAKGERDEIIKEHKIYELLAPNSIERAKIYREKVDKNLPYSAIERIEKSLNSQTIIANSSFISEIEKIAGLCLSLKKAGRPKKEQNQNSKKRDNMYKNLVILSKEEHKNLKINPLENLLFAKDLVTTPILIEETANIGASFPVVFIGEEKASLVTLTSLGRGNLAINKDGKYVVNYVPAFLRKYPFALGASKENPSQKLVLIDEGAEVFSKTKGKQLFDKNSQNTEILQNAIKFITQYEEKQAITQAIVQEIANSGILEDREISIGEKDEKKVLVNGFKVVDMDKLKSLDDKILASWTRRGIITFIDLHIKSLENIKNLFNLAASRQS